MCHRLLIALLLVIASPCVRAQASAGGAAANDGNGASVETESAGNPARRVSPAIEKRSPAPVRSEPARSTQPRWHSFLPGMFR